MAAPFTRTGVNHLLSISGLHVTMIAALAGWLVIATEKTRHLEKKFFLPKKCCYLYLSCWRSARLTSRLTEPPAMRVPFRAFRAPPAG